MTGDPKIIKELREAEKLGRLYGQSQSSHIGLEVSEELMEDISDGRTKVFNKGGKDREFDIESMQYNGLSWDELVDEKELLHEIKR